MVFNNVILSVATKLFVSYILLVCETKIMGMKFVFESCKVSICQFIAIIVHCNYKLELLVQRGLYKSRFESWEQEKYHNAGENRTRSMG